MSISKRNMANIFVIVGSNNSGKDEIIRAVYELGGLHAQIIPKYTSRKRDKGDGKEIKCNYEFKPLENGNYNVKSREDYREYPCDIVYKKNENFYGINSHEIWSGLRNNRFQVIVVSEIEAINSLRKIFGGLVILIYTHSREESEPSSEFKMFVENFNSFDHVLLYESRKEDLYDQLFRLFRAYEA